MAFSFTRNFFGVCGNFRFKIFTLTDAQTTSSVMSPDMAVEFVASTNTSDNADHMRARVLSWASTADTDVTNELKDTAVTFVPQLTGSMGWNTTDTSSPLGCLLEYKDGDELYCRKTPFIADGVGGQTMTVDTFPDGNETYTIYDDHKIMVTPVSADDDGTIIVFGR